MIQAYLSVRICSQNQEADKNTAQRLNSLFLNLRMLAEWTGGGILSGDRAGSEHRQGRQVKQGW